MPQRKETRGEGLFPFLGAIEREPLRGRFAWAGVDEGEALVSREGGGGCVEEMLGMCLGCA